ncbi:MAG: Hint domain-containing protein [Cyanobacteria bacterium P01_C01_bin.72]
MVSFSSSNIEVDLNPFSLEVGEFTGDSNLDIRVSSSDSNYDERSVTLLFNIGGGNFTPIPLPDESPLFFRRDRATGDFNGDGVEDTFFRLGYNYDGSPSIILGFGAGNTTEFNPEGVPDEIYNFAAGDFNGDGLTDLAVITGDYNDDSPVTILLNTTEPSTNQPPDAVDDSFTTDQGASLFFNVLTNDSDPDGGSVQLLEFTDPANGSINQLGDVTFYNPNSNFIGTDTFTYTIVDDEGLSDTATVTIEVECFLTGTHILTDQGEVLVEELKIGDMVKTADGKLEAIKWIGKQTANPSQIKNPLRGYPILIKAGALGNGFPVRDLYTSPDHAYLVDGLLINAGALVNDISIIKTEPTETFTYYHVELANHALLVVEGASAESYFPQRENRDEYDNAAEYYELCPYGSKLMLFPMDYPRVSSHNKVPRYVRQKLIQIAEELYVEKAA